jgi:ABC-type polysaccharide/polyol phosphate transport system ATPase subunit
MQRRVEEIVEFSGLGERIRHPLYTYSSGMRARLAFSIATSVEPEILVIDEGIGAADEEFIERSTIRLNEFLNKAGILIMASHNSLLLQQFCSSKFSLSRGNIHAS